MPKLTDIRFNIHYIRNTEGELLKMTELILLTSKPKYKKVDGSNELEKSYKIKEHRIEVSENDLSVLIEALTEIKILKD